MANSRKSSQQWFQHLELYFLSLARCSEAGRQAGPAAQGCH